MLTLLAASMMVGAAPTQPTQGPSSDWRQSSLSPAELAAKVDHRLNELANCHFQYLFECKSDQGTGYLVGDSYVKNPRLFKVTFPSIGTTEDTGMLKGIWVSDGQRLMTMVEWPKHESKIVKEPFPGHRGISKNLLQDWFRNGPKYVLASIGSRIDPLTALIRAASAPKSGFQVVSNERDALVSGHLRKYYRIQVSRKAGNKQVLYEIVIAGHYFLPSAPNNVVKRGGPARVVFAAGDFLPTSLNNEVKQGRHIQSITLNRTDWELKPKAFDPRLFTADTFPKPGS